MKPPRTGLSTVSGRSDKPEDALEIRVIVIEDPTIFRDGLTKLLSDQSDLVIVATTNSVVEATEQIEKERPNIILLGWPASSANSQRIFNAIQEGKIPARVILLVKEDVKEDFVEAVRHGCCGIVPKQTSTELLLKSIRKVHAGEFWLDRMTTADVIRRLAKKNSAHPSAARIGLREHAAALSQRELEIVVLVAQGFKNKEMAERMFISEQTVKNHLHNIFDKLGVSDRQELALYAIHNNLHEAQ